MNLGFNCCCPEEGDRCECEGCPEGTALPADQLTVTITFGPGPHTIDPETCPLCSIEDYVDTMVIVGDCESWEFGQAADTFPCPPFVYLCEYEHETLGTLYLVWYGFLICNGDGTVTLDVTVEYWGGDPCGGAGFVSAEYESTIALGTGGNICDPAFLTFPAGSWSYLGGLGDILTTCGLLDDLEVVLTE